MRQAGPDEAVALFEQEAASPPAAAARRLAAGGRVLLWEGRPVLAALSPEPILGTDEVFVAWLPRDIAESPDEFRCFVTAVRAHWPGPDRVIVRTAPGWRQPAGAVRHSRYVAWPAGAGGRPAARLNLAPIQRDADRVFAAECLESAVITGYRDHGIDVSRDDVTAFVRAAYLSGEGGVHILVARHEGSMVGLATWIEKAEDEVTGAAYDELVDVYVAAPHTGRGHARAITSHLAWLLRESPRDFVGHIGADLDGRHEVVFEQLRAAGWRPHYDLWLAH